MNHLYTANAQDAGDLGLRPIVSAHAKPLTSTSCGVDLLRQLGGYLILPNAFFWLGGHFFFTIPRALFNVDYLIIGLLGLFLSPTALMIMFTVVVLLDVLAGTISFFYFSQHDLIHSARYLVDIGWQYSVMFGMVLLGLALAIALLSCKVAGRVQTRNRRNIAGVLGVSLFVLTVSRYRDSFEGVWLASSPAHRVYGAAVLAMSGNAEFDSLTPVPSATGQLLVLSGGLIPSAQTLSQQRNLVLVLVESYGLMQDVHGAARLEAPFYAPAVLERYHMQTGVVPFEGPTVSGEFRELCGVRAEIGSTRLASQISGKCLPMILRKRGYETTASHGFLGVMFDRKSWYWDLRFENVQFLENLRGWPGMHVCNGLCPGICDVDVARLLGRELVAKSGGKPQFHYWMTLSSHLPVPRSRENSALMACGSPAAANPDVDICNWMALVYKANSAIAALSLTPGLPPTEFIIVGDHAPPFLSSKRRNQFSQTMVPFIHLIPKSQPGETTKLARTMPVK